MRSIGTEGVFASLIVLVFLAGAYSCTDSDLEVKQKIDVKEVDDQLYIHGQVCAQPPDNAFFPVKVMFVVDCSGSLQQTDETDHRVEAIRQVVLRYANNPQVSFNILKFNGKIQPLTTGFQSDLTGNEEDIFGPTGLLEADSMTDYQGGLGKAYSELLKDMLAQVPATLSRTKYVVIFFSDGTPDPVCYGCSTDGNSPRYNPACTEDLHVYCLSADTPLNMREVANQHGTDDTPEDDRLFLGLEDGTDYNNDYQITGLVDDIMDLKNAFHVGELRFHTAFLYCRDQFGNPTSALCEAAEIAYNLDPERGRALLREMARRGNGTFRDFTSGQDINFLKIDYTSIKSNYIGKNLAVTNLQAFPSSTKYVADSDGDGLSDEEEYKEGTNPLLVDTDGDGYRDIIEIRYRNAGFDPVDAKLPAGNMVCTDTSGMASDKLSTCEQRLLGIDPDFIDNDRDGFPDLMEVVMGTEPLADDTAADPDADGHRNGDELLFHTDPTRVDEQLWSSHRYWYEMQPVTSESLDQQCYNFDIRYITLVTTLKRTGAPSRGYNDILLWFDQASNDTPQEPGRFRVACVRAMYVEPNYKIPVTGDITLTDADFVDPSEVDLSFDNSNCVTASNN